MSYEISSASDIQWQFQNDLWYNAVSWKIEQGFPLTKNTDTLLSTFTRSWTGSTWWKFNIGNDWTITANWTVADTLVIQPASWTTSIWINIRATNWSSTVAWNLWMVWWNNGYAQWSVLWDMVLRNLDATKKLIFWLSQLTPYMQLTPTGLKLMYTTASANAWFDLDFNGESVNRFIWVNRRTAASSTGSWLFVTAWWATPWWTDLTWGILCLRSWISTGIWTSQTIIQIPTVWTSTWTSDNSAYVTIAAFRSTFASWRLDVVWFSTVNNKISGNASSGLSHNQIIAPSANSLDEARSNYFTTTLNPATGVTLTQSSVIYADHRFGGTANANLWHLKWFEAITTLDSWSFSTTTIQSYTWYSFALTRSTWTATANILWDVAWFAINTAWSVMYTCVNKTWFLAQENWIITSWSSLWFYAKAISSWAIDRVWVKIDAPSAWATWVSAWIWLTDISTTTRGGIRFGTDTNLYRSWANTLNTSSKLSNTGMPNYVSNAAANADATLATWTLYTVTVGWFKQVFQK
jgi:hypothetical protein